MSSQRLELTGAVIEEIDDLYSIETAAHAHPWSLNLLRSSFRSPQRVYKLSRNGEIVGFAVVMCALDQWELLDIAISSKAQGQGLGRVLLEGLIEFAVAENAAEFFLEVRRSNLAATRLYRRCGFEQIGLRRSYYQASPGREDAVIMKLGLPPSVSAGSR